MLRAGCQCVGDLVKKRVAHFLDWVQKRQCLGQGNLAVGVVTPPEPPARIVERERPTGKPMPGHQVAGKMGGFVQVQRNSGWVV